MSKLVFISLLLFSFTSLAGERCISVSLSEQKLELEKFILKFDSEKNGLAKIRFVLNKKEQGGNGFFCSHEKGITTCKGDDNSGTLLIKKNVAKIKFLSIHKAQKDDYIEIKEIRDWLGAINIDCSKFSQK